MNEDYFESIFLSSFTSIFYIIYNSYILILVSNIINALVEVVLSCFLPVEVAELSSLLLTSPSVAAASVALVAEPSPAHSPPSFELLVEAL